MTKRSIVAVLIVAALLLIPSCDAETFMRNFGTNVLGGVGGAETINQLEEQIDLIIGGEENPEEPSYDKIVDLVVKATRNPDTESKMLESLSKTTTEASETIRTEVDTILAEVNKNIDSDISFDDFTDENIDSLLESIESSEDIPSGLKNTAKTAVNDLKKLVDGINGVEGAYTPTKGDVVIIKSIASVADTILAELNTSEGEEVDVDKVVDAANEALKMFNTVKSSTVFSNLDLNGVIDELMSSLNSPEPDEGETVEGTTEGEETV